jgi:putative FmdB family regulatory protein
MPLFEYECDSHGHRFEVIQKSSDSPLPACPICGGPVRKLPSSPAIQFKGAGWYVNDYGRKGAAGNTTEPPASRKNGENGKNSPSSGSTSTSSSTDNTSASSSSKDS